MKYLIAFFLFTACFSTTAYAEKAIFAGGCFWCVESDFEKVEGVLNVISGYTGGKLENPTYEQVSHTNTGHFEAVEVEYNPDKVTYAQLLDYYWHHIDPMDANGQFCDKGSTYRSAIFTANSEQQQLAETSKKLIQEKLGADRPVVTQILPTMTFYPAEPYHQNYYKVNSVRYEYYRWSCGRDARVNEIWGKTNL